MVGFFVARVNDATRSHGKLAATVRIRERESLERCYCSAADASVRISVHRPLRNGMSSKR